MFVFGFVCFFVFQSFFQECIMVKVRISYIVKDFCLWYKVESCYRFGGRGNVFFGNRQGQRKLICFLRYLFELINVYFDYIKKEL